MAKKLGCFGLVLILLFSGLVINVSATSNTESKAIKRVVSIVYDDSGSMNNQNEDWAYASYAMQNLIGLMNPQDELGVVKMSKPMQTVGFDFSTNEARAEGIKNVEGWRSGGDTPFEAVQTAVDWLKIKKSGYAENKVFRFVYPSFRCGAFGT